MSDDDSIVEGEYVVINTNPEQQKEKSRLGYQRIVIIVFIGMIVSLIVNSYFIINQYSQITDLREHMDELVFLLTPSPTFTNTATPLFSPTPSQTLTPTLSPTPSHTPTITFTPSPSHTPLPIQPQGSCRGIINFENAILYRNPSSDSEQLLNLSHNEIADALRIIKENNRIRWVELRVRDTRGWLRAIDFQANDEDCLDTLPQTSPQ